jgi:leader peptidase (prepilin peptidase)/N-methyltransferase
MIEAILAGLSGLLIGSFLNVCIHRLPRDESVVHPRSHCPQCGASISWYDNVPVISWVLLKGHCRNCHSAITYRYPLVEVLTGICFFIAVWFRGPSLEAAKSCVFAAIMVDLIFTDFEERILPDEFTLGGTVLGIIFAALAPASNPLLGLLLPWQLGLTWLAVLESAATAAFLAGTLWSIGRIYALVRKREGLGLGDVKMVACIGAFLGLAPALLALLGGSLLGSIVGLAWIVLMRKEAATYELPFGSFLGIAAGVIGLLPPVSYVG